MQTPEAGWFMATAIGDLNADGIHPNCTLRSELQKEGTDVVLVVAPNTQESNPLE
jgi:hypothetical protein